MPEPELLPIATRDFDEIEAALTSSSRGRAFLGEYTRRHGSGGPDITTLLQAVARLERRVSAVPPIPDIDLLRDRLGRLQGALTDARRQMAPGMRPGETGATDGADLVASSGTATSEILEAAELIQETTWRMREAGTDAALCDCLDDRAAAIYAACARHEALGFRVATVSVRIAEALTHCEGLARAFAGQPSLAVLNGTPLAHTSEDIAFVAKAEEPQPGLSASGPA